MDPVGNGLTVMLNKYGFPVQPFACDSTLIVATRGAVPVFVAVNPGITGVFPVEARPIDGLLFVQLKEVPET
jgi:hypothetical protein